MSNSSLRETVRNGQNELFEWILYSKRKALTDFCDSSEKPYRIWLFCRHCRWKVRLIREVPKLRLTVFTPVLLGIIYIASSLDYHVTLVVDTCHPLARGRNGDTQNTTLVMTGRLEQTLRTPLTGQWSASKIVVTAYWEGRSEEAEQEGTETTLCLTRLVKWVYSVALSRYQPTNTFGYVCKDFIINIIFLTQTWRAIFNRDALTSIAETVVCYNQLLPCIFWACHRKRHIRGSRVRKVCPTPPQPCKT